MKPRTFLFVLFLLASTALFAEKPTLYLPKLTLKTSINPILVFFPVNSADIGVELRVGQKWTVEGFAGGYYDSPIYSGDDYTRGWFGCGRVKRYFVSRRGIYTALQYGYVNLFHSPTLEFPAAGGTYSKRTTLHRESQTLALQIGTQRFKPGSWFSIDASVGIGIEWRNTTSLDLNGEETQLLLDGKVPNMSKEKPGLYAIPYFPLGARIGIVLVK